MNEHDHILEEFDKLLQTLDTISVGLQLDVITKLEIKLNQFKSHIKSKPNEDICHSNAEQNVYFGHKSDPNQPKSDPNSGHNSVLTTSRESNVRKSERIHKRETQRIGSKLSEKHTESGQNRTFIEEIPLEEQPIDGVDTHSDQTLSQKQKTSAKDSESSNRRKWRRTKDINDLKCKYCGKIWRSLSHLEIHLRTHTGEKSFECQQCGHRFAQLAGLQVHQRRHNNDRRFECEVCRKAFYTKIDLTRHKSSHKELKSITHCCDKCGKGFSETRQLKNHIRYVHEKKESVVCEICGHMTHGQHLLYAHKRVKHGEMSKYACPVCQTVIGSRSAFVVHLRAHADVKPCACDICGKQFRSKSQVARHKLAHMEGRHECHICAKKFKTPHHLRRHQVIHSGNKPFECHLCQYKCNVKSNVVKHVKSVHGIVDFSFAKQRTPTLDAIQTDAYQKGSVVTQEVLNEISVTKGQTITVHELKRLDEKKKREKEIVVKEMSESVRNRKQFSKQRVTKRRKDILDDAIASTINDISNTTCADNMSEVPLNVSIEMSGGSHLSSHLTPVIIQNPSHIYEVATVGTQQPLKVISSLTVNSEQHFKEVISLHLTQ